MNIKFSEIVENKEYRERIIKYFRLPIRLSVSKEKFLSDLEYLEKAEYNRYMQLVHFVETDFNKLAVEQGTREPDFTMEDILEPLIEDISKRAEWIAFMEKDYSGVLEDYDGIKNTHAFYKKENDGKHFVSIDLKAANWQSLQSILNIEESYEELISQYTDNLIPPSSKTFRTKITGILGSKNITLYNQKILKDNKSSILQSIEDNLDVKLKDKSIFAFYADEFLIEVDRDTLSKLQSSELGELETKVFESTGVQIHIRPFTLKWLNVNKGCIKDYEESFEVINISKDISMLMSKLLLNVEIKDIDFEGIKFKDKSREEFIRELKISLEINTPYKSFS